MGSSGNWRRVVLVILTILLAGGFLAFARDLWQSNMARLTVIELVGWLVIGSFYTLMSWYGMLKIERSGGDGA